jgi:hypothetical protein
VTKVKQLLQLQHVYCGERCIKMILRHGNERDYLFPSANDSLSCRHARL